MNALESARIESRIAKCRAEIKTAGKAGDAVLARAYAEELLSLLKTRDPKWIAQEEAMKGLV